MQATQSTACCFEQILEVASNNSHLPPISQTMKDMQGTAGEVRMNSLVTFTYILPHIDTPVLAEQSKLTIRISVDCRCHLENLSRGMADKDVCQERVKRIHAVGMPFCCYYNLLWSSKVVQVWSFFYTKKEIMCKI